MKINKPSNTILETERYLEKKYEFRMNVINHKIECKQVETEDWKELNENNIFIELHKSFIHISMANLLSLLKSDFVQKYNPIETYFNNLNEWDLNDHIGNLSNHIITEERERFDLQFKKMLVRTIACALDDNVFNKQAFILVHGQQNSGKTTFIRFLVPTTLKEYYAETIGTDKDSRIALCENFIINLDELAKLNKNDINELKSVFSSQSEKLRRPYDRRAERLTRRASFIGSTNSQEFLTDETGSVRWLCFNISKINWDYPNTIDIDKVWSQAFHLYRTGYKYQLTKEEIEENEHINAAHNIVTSEMELIQLYLKPGTTEEHDEFWTSTQIMQYLVSKVERTISLKPVLIGKALKVLEFERVQWYNGKYQIKGYYLSYLLTDKIN
ncbi:MAG: virulence protein E [Cyclobacteriaceae bacterium]|nr:virulence protein E [Cyclobacteriaceae bacterium]